jgi:hypothetical protein
VRIGTCANAIDAAFVRSMFEARGIPIVIGAEHHASLLGPIHGAFLTLDIWVDSADADEAARLLHDLRSTDADSAPDPTEGVDAEDLDGDGEWRARPAAAPPAAARTDRDDDMRELIDRRARSYQRRRNVIAVLSGMILTFGTAHMFTGAWLRGLALALIEAYGFLTWRQTGLYIVGGAIIFDVLGTLIRVLAGRPARPAPAQTVEPRERGELPRAQLRS